MKYDMISLNEKMKDEDGYSRFYCGLIKKEGYAYLIMAGRRHFLGEAIIDDSDDKVLNLDISFNDDVDEYLRLNFVKKFTECIGYYYPKKEMINLSFDGDSYEISNRDVKERLQMICQEMRNTADELTEAGFSWTQSFCKENECAYEYDEFVDREKFSEIERSEDILPEVFIKNSCVLYEDIKSNNNKRIIAFNKNGEVDLYKRSKRSYSNAYNICYDVVTKAMRVERPSMETIITLKDNLVNVSYENNSINGDRESFSISHFNNSKRINFVKQMDARSSILFELIEAKSGNIKKCNVDLRTHKGSGKISGIYALRIRSVGYPVSLRSIDRHGYQTCDFSEFLNLDEEMLREIMNGNITYEMIDFIIRKTIPVVNDLSSKLKRAKIAGNVDLMSIERFIEMEMESVNYLKQIKDEIPVSGMREAIKGATLNYSNDKKKLKKI